MKIALDNKHFLNSDAYCYWITCLVTRTDKDGNQKTSERRVSGYMDTFNGAVNSYIERKIRSSEAAEIEQLNNEVEELKQEVRGWEMTLEGSNNG